MTAESRHSLRVRNLWLGLRKAAIHCPCDQNIIAAPVIKGGNAQITYFAKFSPFPYSGLSWSVRRKPVESPL